FINQWESEAFRKKLAIGAGQGQLVDRVAVVTGAGSGLGRAIAVGFARAGACVVLADIDVASAEETAKLIKEELPSSQSIVLGCNVTDEKSVQAGFEKIMDEFGGLDILVNAAGVAPAGPMTEIPVAKWRFALEVNLTGYFLMAQNAAKLMISQGMAGCIINLTSKSGLEASKNNTPYNATKAGEIHMARGWALELGRYGIRVNCVAAGNVFEGSKIWNPQYIAECAKKYSITPEEVIPYYVSKTALNKEIKGQDIADSIVFLCSDNARKITGQTIVTDAGQVMVR
ncbi:MAG TPA: SDR family oxidoreductase, partial [Sedimentisphaerales bacterium]|nr:SDR family oxidoreductase [Sedimentisphaerales bacterium]